MSHSVRWTSDRATSDDDRNSASRPRLLLICDYRPREAATVIDHIDAIHAWSRYDVFVLPTYGDLPDELDLAAFDGLVIHYNVVMSSDYYLSPFARWRISQFGGVKAAFIQDEYRFVDRTIGVMRTLGVQVLFTCVPQDQLPLVYPDEALPRLRRKITVLTGYVPEEMLSRSVRPYGERSIDVGYRGRRLPLWLGRLAQEKVVIADRFAADAPRYELVADISYREEDRLYSDAWIDFISSCKAMLGVESGASVFDFDGSVERAVREFMAAQPDASFDDVHRACLADVDGRIRLNQISPRCFEAAALGTLMVLYPGEYSGILTPWRHYVPLLKDHSNMEEVVRAIRDRETCERITKFARDEVALNPSYSFKAMVKTVDDALDLPIAAQTAVDPRVFAGVASRSFARMPNTQLHRFGLPPLLNRLRQIPGKLVRRLLPSPVAISAPAGPTAIFSIPRVRLIVRYLRALTYWAIRPAILPSALLVRHRGALLQDLSALGRLQEAGIRGQATGAGSPFAVLFANGVHELRVVLRTDVPTAGRQMSDQSPDMSWASDIYLRLSDPWLLPVGIGDSRSRQLKALSAVLRRRPDVGRRLVAGRAAWCDVVAIEGDAPQ